MGVEQRGDDEVLGALDAVTAALEETVGNARACIERAAAVRARRLSGMPYHDIIDQADRPLIVELISQTLAALQRTGHRLRSAEAKALYAEGMTMTRIAALFGVSHQRISALIHDEPGTTTSPGARRRSLSA